MTSNYPPGVSGNEPQITGAVEPEVVVAEADDVGHSIEQEVSDLLTLADDAGVLSREQMERIEAASTTLSEMLHDYAATIEHNLEEVE